jgi:hypothetical protein
MFSCFYPVLCNNSAYALGVNSLSGAPYLPTPTSCMQAAPSLPVHLLLHFRLFITSFPILAATDRGPVQSRHALGRGGDTSLEKVQAGQACCETAVMNTRNAENRATRVSGQKAESYSCYKISNPRPSGL